MPTSPTAPLTEEQYLRIEREAETKSEFHDGQMFAMAIVSPIHALLASRIGALLYPQMPPGPHLQLWPSNQSCLGRFIYLC
jgi:Uma2 family endonuclease